MQLEYDLMSMSWRMQQLQQEAKGHFWPKARRAAVARAQAGMPQVQAEAECVRWMA